MRATRPAVVLTALVLTVGLSLSAEAKAPVDPLHLAIGYGVEQDASPEREILALWKHYLTEPSDSIRAILWSAEESSRSPSYDLLWPYVYQGFTHLTVIHLGLAPGLAETFFIRTLVSAVDDSTLDVRPLALYRVYAKREGGRWVLANALPYGTRDWQRVTIGHVTFVCPPSHKRDDQRARGSAAFVDSLAHAFGLPEPEPITYYFSDDLGETLRALGLEYFPTGGDPLGGRSNVAQRHVYVGSSADGEGYRHELAHIVLAPEVSGGRTAYLVVEGLMTWTGGSAGLGYRELLPDLARYLSEHPDLTLQSLLENPPSRVRGQVDVGYAGLAVLCKMLFDRTGLPGLRALLSAGREPGSVVGVATRQLGVTAAELNSIWRDEAGVPRDSRRKAARGH